MAAIAAHVRALQAALLDDLAGIPAWAGKSSACAGCWSGTGWGPILCFHHGELGPEGLQDLLKQGARRGVYASVREGYLRVAFHGWHEEADLNRMVDWLKSRESHPAATMGDPSGALMIPLLLSLVLATAPVGPGRGDRHGQGPAVPGRSGPHARRNRPGGSCTASPWPRTGA